MYKIIYRYEIPMQEHFSIKMPIDAKFLTIQHKDGVPCMWFEVEGLDDYDFTDTKREFQIVGTGERYGEDRDVATLYLGTFQSSKTGSQTYVFHVFELLHDSTH